MGAGQPILIPRPGEIYLADIGGADKHRAIVVSREALNRGTYVVAVPITSTKFAERANMPNCVPFRCGQFGFDRDCVAQAEQITFLSKSRLDLDHGPIDCLDGESMYALTRAIGNVIEAECEPSPFD